MNPALLTSAPCAACGTAHDNTALCDDCAEKVAAPCPCDDVEGCPCLACVTACRALGALAEAGSDLRLHTLPEVRAAREVAA